MQNPSLWIGKGESGHHRDVPEGVRQGEIDREAEEQLEEAKRQS